MKTWIMVAAFIGIFSADGQTKKWDGEAGDGMWSNGKNWFPDGIPQASDHVDLDHSIVSGGYEVLLPDGNIVVEAYSITIEGNEKDSIKVVIPATNTVSPSLILNNPTISLNIKNAGILINRSGANTGNTLQLAGNIRIENGGTYLHQTVRGTAAMAAKMIIDDSTCFGIFEMDVPGTAGYILSLSGRTYGTLRLSAQQSGGKRTYSGSGNNLLDIKGDFQIGKGASLIISLNGNIQIKRGLWNEGSVQLNPTSTDTMSRSIIFTGDHAFFSNEGSFNCNTFFRNIRVAENASLQLKTNLELPQNQLLFELQGQLICDTNHIGGLGKFKSNHGAWIRSSSAVVLSNNINEGNIRLPQYEISKGTGFSFNGGNDQHTGNAFPDSISALSMHKVSGMLTLDKPMHVEDSLLLKKGILKSDPTNLLSFSGRMIRALNPYQKDDTSHIGYVSGEMQYDATTQDSIFFPLGNDTNYAPCIIKGALKKVYRINFDTQDHLHAIPMKFTQKGTAHWHIQKMSSFDTIAKNEKISLFINTSSLVQKEQPLIIFNNTMDSNWMSQPVTPVANSEIFLQSQPLMIKNGVYTIASQFLAALPKERIYLFKYDNNGMKGLKWQTELEAIPTQFIVEKSINGFSFQSLAIQHEKIHQQRNEYQITLPLQETLGFFRVVALVGDRKVMSNIIHLENTISGKVYPIPAVDCVHIQLEQVLDSNLFELIDMMGRKILLKMTWNGRNASIDVRDLHPGKYVLILHQGSLSKIWSIIKE